MENWKTVSQIAKETGITRQKIYRYVYSSMIDVDASERPKQADMIKQVGHTYYLSPDAEKRVTDHFRALQDTTGVNHHESSMYNHDETNDETQSDVVDELRARVDSLEREVDRLHELLRHTQTELEQAHTIVSQQQVLMLQTTGKSTDSTDGAADEQHATAPEFPDKQQDNNTHKSIWKRIFNRE